MKRRDFLKGVVAAPVIAALPALPATVGPSYSLDFIAGEPYFIEHIAEGVAPMTIGIVHNFSLFTDEDFK